MPFLCLRSPLPEWFTAIIREDGDYIQQNLGKYSGKFDERQTDSAQGNVHGIAGIHYAAIYNRIVALQLLIPEEYSLVSKTPMQLTTVLLPNAKAFQLASGQDALHISLARGNFFFAREVLNYHHTTEQSIIGKTDDDGHTHLMILAYFPLTKEIASLMSETQLINEFPMFIQGRGYLHVVAFMKRLDHLLFSFQLMKKFPQLVEYFYIQLVGVHKGFTIFEFISSDIDYQKCSSAAENKDKMHQILFKLLPQAIKHLQKDMRRFGAHLGEFFKACKFEIPMFVQEYELEEFAQISQIKLEKLNEGEKKDENEEENVKKEEDKKENNKNDEEKKEAKTEKKPKGEKEEQKDEQKEENNKDEENKEQKEIEEKETEEKETEADKEEDVEEIDKEKMDQLIREGAEVQNIDE
ncbi:Conserved_hypothetical protein [Hexamita inflata]|uniref:Ankyrin repeat-containing protein n=1 Tax=Hexamita inflata TaxID=28002 RepID=A0AA86QYX8_9EUKA|nr:Conserved hypothetical protein [Hexamita inflata]